MPKCELCGGEAPQQPCITEDGKCDLCDLCGRQATLADKPAPAPKPEPK